jgi:hypothetical protein
MVRLLNPKAAKAFHDWAMGLWAIVTVFVGDINLDRFQRWLWGTPQEQRQLQNELPYLDQTIEALFVAYQQHMDTQHEVMAIKREMMTLPALPDEGY